MGLTLLLCDDGRPASLPALAFGETLALLLRADLTILDLAVNSSGAAPESRTAELLDRLVSAKLACRLIRREGIPLPALLDLTIQQDFDLVIVGLLNGDSHLRSWLRGPSTRRILQQLESPLLVVPSERLKIQRILVCSGELWHPAEMLRIVTDIALAAFAEIVLLYVVPQPVMKRPMAHGVEEAWGAILQNDTPQSRHLKDNRATLQAAGIDVDVRIRHGLVSEQILAEIREGEYDLVALGSTYASQSLYRLFTRSITDFIVEHAQRPVLVVRYHADDVMPSRTDSR